MKKRPILNYTTEVPAAKSAYEIQARLAEAGALEIRIEYSPDGKVAAMAFSIMTKLGVVAYRLPANVDGVHQAIVRSKSRISARQWKREQSERIAWRILKDWIEVQLAFVKVQLADMAEVFLPYTVCADGRSAYQLFREGSMRALTQKPAPTTGGSS